MLIEVAQTLRSHRELADQIWKQAIVHELIMLALTVVLLWVGLSFGLRPLIRLRDAVLERHPGALEPLAAGPLPQELAPLVSALNEYVRRLDEHAAAHGRFVAYASHQLRTALSVLNTQVSFALGSEDAAAREDALQGIRNGVRDAIRLVNQLLTLFMAEAAAQASPEQRGAALVRGASTMLHELVANLVDNAIRYTPRGGVVTAALEGSAESVTLRIEDNGPGIPVEQRERVFEPFYRLQDDGPGGSGLGLPIVREIAAASQASVQLAAPLRGSGLVVSVVFA
jgi:two-component system sensor histidine kinase TctE